LNISKFATIINNTSGIPVGKFTAIVLDIGGKFATGVVDTSGKFASGVIDTSGKFATSVISPVPP
jgi:hypothetical protein